MALTEIADLWQPDVWIKDVQERMATFPRLWNSGVVTRTPLFDSKASGEGVSVNMPFIKDPTDIDDAIQVENSAPTLQEVTGDVLVAPILNRVSPFSSTALAAQVSGADPVAAITGTMAERRLKQRQKVLLANLRGAFGTLNATTSALTAALEANKIKAFDETGTDATADQVMSASLFIDGCALLGELSDDLAGGAMWIHPTVLAGLKKADLNNFTLASRGEFTITLYRGVPVYTSTALARAGGTNGNVFETYLLARGIVGWGEKAQAGDTIDVASMSFWLDKQKNNWEVYDRTRFLMLLNGMKWTPTGGVPAGQSATNTELATITGATANWTLKASSAPRTGAVCIQTNG